MDLTQLLASVAGILISLLAEYLPGFSGWYDGLDSSQKALFMVGCGLVVALAVFGLSCAQLLDLVACTQAGAIELVKAFIAFMLANQSTYLVTRNVHTG